ncbi:MAG: nucleoside phosphorylase [Candidatus Promineifilaceae bacterium]
MLKHEAQTVPSSRDASPPAASLPNLMTPPILEFDPAPTAILEPSELRPKQTIPQRLVLCFFQDVLTKLRDEGRLIVRDDVRVGSEIGRNPVYQLRDQDILVLHPGVGAPLAGAFLEEMIATGSTRVIACGGGGVLDSKLVMGHLIIPLSAVRDEGTSYHYLPPEQAALAHPKAVAAIEATFAQHKLPFVKGKTWTTDGLYRETRAKTARRREQGCLIVEMETAAFFAIAEFRNIVFGQILYGGDDLTGEIWDSREWDKDTSMRERLFWLAIEACGKLEGEGKE